MKAVPVHHRPARIRGWSVAAKEVSKAGKWWPFGDRSTLSEGEGTGADGFPRIPRFEIVSRLGAGGMASVFLAKQAGTGIQMVF